MAGIDIYQPCPGGCGKKIKFCCSKDIAQELERLHRMIAGEQLQAARDKLEQLLRQYPGRNCLLATQVELAVTARDFDAIRVAVAAFTAHAPENPLAISYGMLTEIREGACHAMAFLERAFHAELSDMPDQFAFNLIKCASIFIDQNSFMPGLALLRLSYRYLDAEVPLRDQILMSVERNISIPLMERYDWQLDPVPEKGTWRVEMEMVMAAIKRGAWGWAADYLQQMSLRILDQPILLRTQGLCLAWLDRRREAVTVFRRYAELRNVTDREALWGEMMAQDLGPRDAGLTYDQVVRTYEVRDLDGLLDFLRLSPLFFSMPVDAWPHQDDEGYVRPRCTFSVLDRPVDLSATEAQLDELPQVQSLLAVFGRETDRPARMEFYASRHPLFDAHMARAEELVRPYITGPFTEKVDGKVSAPEFELRQFPLMPPTISRTRRRELAREIRSRAILDRWKNVALPALGNRRPIDIVQTGRAGIRTVAAAIKLLELESVTSLHTDFDTLRDSLGIPREEPWDPTGHEAAITPLDFHRLKLDALSNDALLGVLLLARHFRLLTALRRAAEECLRRDALGALPEPLEWGDVYASMVNTTQDLDESMQWVNKARQRAVAEGKSPAQWLVLELSLRYERGELQDAERVLRKLERRHMREPGVEQMVKQVLQGIRQSMEHMMPIADPPEMPIPGESTSGLWTPDSPGRVQDAALETEPSAQSKLWLPDSP